MLHGLAEKIKVSSFLLLRGELLKHIFNICMVTLSVMFYTCWEYLQKIDLTKFKQKNICV